MTDDAAARQAWAHMRDLVLDNERRRQVADAVELSFGRVRALRRIAREPVTMGELAALLDVEAPYATVVVDDLQRRGLVERRPHPTDRRAKLVAATPAGVALARRAEEVMAEPPASLNALSADQLLALAQMLDRVHGAVPVH